MGGAVFLSIAESLFTNNLIASLESNAPGVNPGQVVATGATQLRGVFSSDQLQGILLAYMDGLRSAFTLVIALAGSATLVSLGAPWVNIKKHAPSANSEKTEVPTAETSSK